MKLKSKKIVSIVVLLFILSLICSYSMVFAANLNVNVNFDGKQIEMTSETPDMTWTINNLLPGEEDSSILTISNIGTRKASVEFTATIEEGKDLADVLDIQIIKLANDSQKEDKEVFSGKYSELQTLNVELDSDKIQNFKIITSLPIETGNEFQNKECKVKLSFLAKGIEDVEPEPEPEVEPTPEPEPPKEIITDVIKPVQTGESKTIYIIVGVLVVAAIILIVTFFIGKGKKKDNK